MEGQIYKSYLIIFLQRHRDTSCVEMSVEKDPLVGSCRLVLTIMVFFGVYHLMALRFNLSMALGETRWPLFSFEIR